MSQPAAKQDDLVQAQDTHIQMVPSPGGPVATPLPSPFSGPLNAGLSGDVNIEGKPAAIQGCSADNDPPHVPDQGPFQTEPSNKATVIAGSATVNINGVPAVRNGDTAMTCNDPVDLPIGTVVAAGTVNIGG
ncbi:PAAR domain-containing protein [Sulfidibacter corallicola]|uniref:PAAR domain-containing protein n=1 Tax=Sulfidibacter corallicola TaxID=2818388 RepID=A0A8A4TP87_SULCO|nr:PAAR domain-containing protein [Sulfidibacter corallicola]QTD51360.1 PAAR domain-containing protein [Sulfidibacter corallicola]